MSLLGLAFFAAAPAGAVTPQIQAGGDHTCAVENTGTVKCFGRNDFGQLGVSANSGTANPTPTPTTVDLGGAKAVQVAGGALHTCVLLEGGTVKCFGQNVYGQLGNTTNSGNTNPNPTPTTVDLGGAKAV